MCQSVSACFCISVRACTSVCAWCVYTGEKESDDYQDRGIESEREGDSVKEGKSNW